MVAFGWLSSLGSSNDIETDSKFANSSRSTGMLLNGIRDVEWNL